MSSLKKVSEGKRPPPPLQIMKQDIQRQKVACHCVQERSLKVSAQNEVNRFTWQEWSLN